MEYVLWTLAVLFVLSGLVGTLVPALPGSVMVFIGLAIAASVDGFVRVGMWTLILLGVMTAVAYVADMTATAYGAKKTGAGKWAVVGALVGSVVGLFFGIAGIILGPFFGAVLGEFIASGDLKRAGISGTGAWLGIVLGTAVKAALAVAMVGIFILMYFF